MIRKFLYRVSAAVVLVAAILLTPACSGGGASDKYADTATYTALSDSIATLLGEVNGYRTLENLNQYRQLVDSTYRVSEFSEGVALVLDRRYPNEYRKGVMLGLQMSQDIASLKSSVKEIDRTRIFNQLEKFINDGFVPLTAGKDSFPELADRFVQLPAGKARTAMADSVMESYARMIGRISNDEVKRARQAMDRPIDKAAFADGIKTGFLTPRSMEFEAGMMYGLNMGDVIEGIEKKGVNIRHAQVLEHYRKILDGGKYNSEKQSEQEIMLRDIMTRVNTQAYEEKEQEMSASKEAEANILKGKKAVKALLEEAPEAKTTESGITYIMNKPGSGPKIEPNDTVVLYYMGSHADGKVFDIQPGMRICVNDVVPGMSESIQLLQKGGKAGFWIPGELAYKGHGVPSKGIGPMELIILHLEVLDVIKANK